MQIQFRKNKCPWSTTEFRALIRYTLTAAFNYLDIADVFQDQNLEPVIDVTFVGPDMMRSINYEQRGKDKVTDVLSFPMLDCYNGELQSQLQISDVDLATQTVSLGDLVICLDRAEEQAYDYGHSMHREVAFLALHGLLHVLGYDHEQDENDRLLMEGLQTEIMDYLGITRDLSPAAIMQCVNKNLRRIDAINAKYSPIQLGADLNLEAFSETSEDSEISED